MMIEARHVRRTFGRGTSAVTALDDVSLEIERGEVVGLVGRSGSGKSTLVNLIGGLDRPDSGTLRIAGLAIGNLDHDALADYRRRVVGMVFQAFHLVPSLTALANVELPLVFERIAREERCRRAQALLERVGLAHRIHHLPSELSGGEQQRVGIARALVLDPPLLLADEPAGNLDSTNAARVVELLVGERQATGRTVVLVTHDEPTAARAADRVLHLADGRIVDEGA